MLCSRLIEENRLAEIGIIIVDELHMLGDSSRGYLLELLLTKLVYMKKLNDIDLQIVGMSATIPNLSDIARWLDAELFITNYRPIPLFQRLVVDEEVFDPLAEDLKNPIRKLEITKLSLSGENRNLVYSALETLMDGYSVLIFCSTKALCEKISRYIAVNIFEYGAKKKFPTNAQVDIISEKLKEQMDFVKTQALLDSLKRSSAGMDANLERDARFGVAFHHGGLSLEERSIIERAFRDGVIRILCCTTTLSAGVNLPARRVIICSPLDYRGVMIDPSCYQQMIGRAGRKGIDVMGESLLFCNINERKQSLNLIQSKLNPIKSCLISTEFVTVKVETSQDSVAPGSSNLSNKSTARVPTIVINESVKRAVLEVISNGTAKTVGEIGQYISSTFYCMASNNETIPQTIRDVLNNLFRDQLIYYGENESTSQPDLSCSALKVRVTQFGKAVISSGISPDEGHFIMSELNKARSNLCLLNDLHLVYHITPTYVSEQLGSLNWQHYLTLHSKLDASMKTVASMIGIRESFLVSQVAYFSGPTKKFNESMTIHRRFYASLALYDLIHEIPLVQVASKYNMSKGLVQNLQQQAATFAGMLTTFCNKLGWNSLELLIDQFQPRLSFGVQRDLIDLMRIGCLTASIARKLFQANYDSLSSLIYCKNEDIESTLIACSTFEKGDKQNVDGEQLSPDPASAKIFIPHMNKYLTIRQLSSMIITEAREIVEADVGQSLTFDNVSPVNSSAPESSANSPDADTKDINVDENGD